MLKMKNHGVSLPEDGAAFRLDAAEARVIGSRHDGMDYPALARLCAFSPGILRFHVFRGEKDRRQPVHGETPSASPARRPRHAARLRHRELRGLKRRGWSF